MTIAADRVFFLAQESVKGLSGVYFWSAVLIGLLILIFFLYSQLKRWMKDPEQPASSGFSLSDLRNLHRQGKMTDQEFEIAKVKILAMNKKMTDQLPPVLGQRKRSDDGGSRMEDR